MENKVKMVKNCIEDLKKEENKKQFVNDLFEAQNPENGRTVIYFDFDENNIFCESIQTGTIIPNSMVLISIIDVFCEKGPLFEEFAEEIIEDLENIENWEYYDEKGEKVIL